MTSFSEITTVRPAFLMSLAVDLDIFASIRFILVETSHPGNIGAAARAMKTMGFQNLYLVAPQKFPDPAATAMAAGAEDVLEKARVVATLDEAIEDCTLLIGSSARTRAISLPLTTPRELSPHILREATHQSVAILFGRESAGLTNLELQRCHHHVFIPANPDYSILNLAQAVQIIAYELSLHAGKYLPSEEIPLEGYAPEKDIRAFYQHLEEALIATGFLDPHNPKQLMARMKRLFQRIRLETMELKMLRGVCSCILESLQERR